MGLSSVIWTLHGVYYHVRARWCGAGPTRACRGDVDAGVATTSSEAAAAVKIVLLVATNIMQAFDGPDGRSCSSAALGGGVRMCKASKTCKFHWNRAKMCVNFVIWMPLDSPSVGQSPLIHRGLQRTSYATPRPGAYLFSSLYNSNFRPIFGVRLPTYGRRPRVPPSYKIDRLDHRRLA